MARLTRSSVPCLHVFDWLRFEHPAGHPADPKAHGKSVTAPLTGQDSRALQAFIHAVELYCVSDEHGRHCAIKAMRALVDAAQPKTHLLFKEAIACAYEWSMRDDLWEQMGLDEQSLREEVERQRREIERGCR